jgi:hypothetical protein
MRSRSPTATVASRPTRHVTRTIKTNTSGHACFTEFVSRSLDNLFGAGSLTPAYTMPSHVEGVPERSYTSTDLLDDETMNARIWNGFHFRSAMTDGNALGHAVADFVVANYFQPTD